jgi:hypothetical protein
VHILAIFENAEYPAEVKGKSNKQILNTYTKIIALIGDRLDEFISTTKLEKGIILSLPRA